MSPQAQGALSQVLAMREASFKTLTVGTVKTKKVYFSGCSLAFSQSLGKSEIIRGGSRHPSDPFRTTADIAGDIKSEFNAAAIQWFAALGSMESVMTGGTMGTALTTPTATIDSVNQTMTINVTSHGLVPGDSVEILALTAPTSLNGKIFSVFDVPTANQFKIAIPLGTTSTFTLGSGTIKKVTAVGSTLTHTLKAGGALPSYTIEKGFTDISQYFKYSGCKCASMTLNFPSAGNCTFNTSWMGGAEAIASSSFETGTTNDGGFISFDGLNIAAADIKEGSTPATIATVRALNLTINNMLDGDTFVVGGGGSRAAINPGVYEISGSVDMVFEDVAIYNKAKAGTISALDLTYKRGTGAGTLGNEYLQLVTPAIKFEAATVEIAGAKGITATFPFFGQYDGSVELTALKAIIKNVSLPGAYMM